MAGVLCYGPPGIQADGSRCVDDHRKSPLPCRVTLVCEYPVTTNATATAPGVKDQRPPPRHFPVTS